MMKIALGSDHGGYALKCKIKEHLESQGYEAQGFALPSLFWKAMAKEPPELLLSSWGGS